MQPPGWLRDRVRLVKYDGCISEYNVPQVSANPPQPPTLLRKAPLIEAIVEVRFKGSHAFLGDLLPGLFFPRLRDRFPTVEPLPMASLPRELRSTEPQFRYQPVVRLAGADSAVLVGDHSVLISQRPPYHGWSRFRDLVTSVLEVLKDLDVAGEIERHSFKCVNLIDYNGHDPLGPINVTLAIPNFDISGRGFKLRAEAQRDSFLSIIEVTSAATLREEGGGSRTGLLLALDAIQPVGSGSEFWHVMGESVDRAHSVVKGIFFDLLRKPTLDSFEPEWGAAR